MVLGVLNSKTREAFQLWKGSQIDTEDYKNLARACRDAIWKAESQQELKLAKGVRNKNNKIIISFQQSCRQNYSFR